MYTFPHRSGGVIGSPPIASRVFSRIHFAPPSMLSATRYPCAMGFPQEGQG